jgi:hypothetical protein
MKNLLVILATIIAVLATLTSHAQNLVESFIEKNSRGSSSFGASVSGAGDVNGDGYDDVIVGADSYGSKGQAYIFYGGKPMDNIADVSLNGGTTGRGFGCSVASAGDVNNDGYADVIVGSFVYSDVRGYSYIFYGGKIFDNTADVIMAGEVIGDAFGCSVSGAGDVNGDGFDDVIVGAERYNEKYGRAYLFYGGSAMDSIADVTFYGESINNFSSYFGGSVSGAGDVNGDGFDDVIVGADGYGYRNGRTYIFFGGTNMNMGADITFSGAQSYNELGCSVSGCGDVNGDGFDDVIVGVYGLESANIYYGGKNMDSKADVQLKGDLKSGYFGTSVSGAGDVNGDGFQDVIVGAYNNSRAYIYYGGNSMDGTSDVTLSDEGDNHFGYSVSGAGDVDGDGFADVITGEYAYNSSTGKSCVFFGSSSMDSIVDVTMIGEETGNTFGNAVSGAGDVNGDGYDDLMVAAMNYNSATGRVYIYFGSKSIDSIADVILTGDTLTDSYGWSIAGAGDVNGDGFDDVIVGNCYHNLSTGRAYLYFGGKDMDNNPDLIFNGEAISNYLGYSVSCAGDVNGDGYDDVIIGAYQNNSNTGCAYIYYGGSTMDNLADITLKGEGTKYYFGCSVSGAGDVNGDGYDDVIVGAFGYNSYEGRTYIYYGGTNMDNLADVIMTGESTKNYFGLPVSSAGDVNGDGYDDVIVSAYHYGSFTGRTYLYLGGSTMDNVADVIMSGEKINSNFGRSVSGAVDVNGDGYDDVIVGANYDYSSTGRAYIFYGGNSMKNTPDITLTGEEINDNFGFSVSAAGDVNGDGLSEVIIGASGYPVNGKAYLYSFNPKPIVLTQEITDISYTTALARGLISYPGTTNPIQYGHCWNTTGNPTISDLKTELGSYTVSEPYVSSLTGLLPGMLYYIRAYATNSYGTSYGEEMTFTTVEKLDQTINFEALSDVKTGENPFVLTATASSGLSVIYSSSNTDVAVIVSDTVTIVSAGITVITASQPGNDNYNAAKDVQQTLRVILPDSKEELDRANDFKIYPNPNNGHFILESTDLKYGSIVDVLNLSGKKILSYHFAENGDQINLKGIGFGVYFVEISDGKNKLVKKIVVK